MGVAWVVIASIAAVAIALFHSLVANEATAWLPRITEALITGAAARLNKTVQTRLLEEWRGDVADVPGPLSRLFFAGGCWLATFPINRQERARARKEQVAAVEAALVELFPEWLRLFFDHYKKIPDSLSSRRWVTDFTFTRPFVLRLRTRRFHENGICVGNEYQRYFDILWDLWYEECETDPGVEAVLKVAVTAETDDFAKKLAKAFFAA